MQHDDNLIDQLARLPDKRRLLLSRYKSHRDFGASPDLCSIFTSRLEALLTEYTSPLSTPESVMKKLIHIEKDFRDMGYFEEPLRVIRKNLEAKFETLLRNRSADD